MRIFLKLRLLLLTIFFASSVFAEKKHSGYRLELLNYQDFLNLTTTEKKDYIREVQNLIND